MALGFDRRLSLRICAYQHHDAFTQTIKVFIFPHHRHCFSTFPISRWFHALLLPCTRITKCKPAISGSSSSNTKRHWLRFLCKFLLPIRLEINKFSFVLHHKNWLKMYCEYLVSLNSTVESGAFVNMILLVAYLIYWSQKGLEKCLKRCKMYDQTERL